MDMNFSRSGHGLFLLLLMMFCLDGLSFISDESASNPDLHYWDARRIENSILRKFHRHDYLKVESELNEQIQQLASAQGSVDEQEVFDTLLSLIECRLRLNGENLYGWLDLLVNHWNENESIRNEYNQAAFLAINFLVDQMSGQWEWGLNQIPIIQNNTRHGLQNLGASFQLLHQYHTGKGSTLVGEAIEFEGLTEMNSLPSLVTLYSIWTYAVHIHDLETMRRCKLEFERIRGSCENDPFWLGMFISTKLDAAYILGDDHAVVENDLEIFKGLGSSELGSFFCIAIDNAIRGHEIWTEGGLQDVLETSSCNFKSVARTWGFSHFWLSGFAYDNVLPKAALIDWEACIDLIDNGVYGSLIGLAKLNYANCLARVGERNKALAIMSEFELESIDKMPVAMRSVAYLSLENAITLGLYEFDISELHKKVVELTAESNSQVIRSLHEYYGCLVCLEEGRSVEDCVYSILLSGDHSLTVPHQLSLLITASSLDFNVKRAIALLEELRTQTENPQHQVEILKALKSIYFEWDMHAEMNAVLSQWQIICRQFFPKNSFPFMQLEFEIHTMLSLTSYNEQAYGNLLDFHERLIKYGFGDTDIYIQTLSLLARAASDIGFELEERKWREKDLAELEARYGKFHPNYVRAFCNNAASNYHTNEEAISETRQCLELIKKSHNDPAELAWYTANDIKTKSSTVPSSISLCSQAALTSLYSESTRMLR